MDHRQLEQSNGGHSRVSWGLFGLDDDAQKPAPTGTLPQYKFRINADVSMFKLIFMATFHPLLRYLTNFINSCDK